MNSMQKKQVYKRIIIAVVVIAAFFCILAVRLVIIQIFQAEDLASRQESYMTRNIEITAKRGTIYDSEMNVLVQDASCSKISVFPNSIEDPQATASFLAETLGLDYDDVYADVTNTEASYITIKKGVDNATALKIKEADLAGVDITEDTKRHYSDSTFAQYVLGFTGTDHTGLYGLEAVFNDVLGGENGSKTVLTDSAGRIIESASVVQKEATAGSNLVTTINSVIQYYAESAAYDAYLTYKPQRVLILVSDPNTGDVLAMAAYPGYSLDDPWQIPSDYATSFSSTLEGMDTASVQLEMWKNPFTSLLYEPGSTFKVITASSALEENVVSLDSSFYCNGYLEVGGVKIKCHVYPNGHGSQNLTEAVVNSCNPAMMNVAMQMGPDVFYKYIYDYGFGEATGINLDGEESGILTVNQDINVVDYVTLGFGQGLAVTPIQMLQALNAAINGGELLYPNIVKYILDPETNDITYTYEKQVVRQVISQETSQTMQQILYATAQNIYSISDYKDLPIGGKTGTAQKFINGQYTQSLYVSSFYGMIPYNDPQLSVLVIVDEASGWNTTGSAVAAPIGARVLSEAYSYLLTKQDVPTSADVESGIKIPDVRGRQLSEAENIFKAFGIDYSITGDQEGIVTAQSAVQSEYQSGMTVVLTVTSQNSDQITVPDLSGMSVQKVNSMLTQLGLSLNVQGGGIAVSQDVKAGSVVDKGTTITVTFKYIE